MLDERRVGKKEFILSRIWLVLKGKIRKKNELKKVELIIDERNKIVHAGQPATAGIELNEVYKIYCRLILFFTNNIELIDSNDPEYISTFFDSYFNL